MVSKRMSRAQRFLHVEVSDSTAGKSSDWSVEEGGRGFVYPERLDGGEDFLLVASKGHAHSEQVFGVQLRDDVQAGESGLQEALLVSLHLYGSKPLGDRTTG